MTLNALPLIATNWRPTKASSRLWLLTIRVRSWVSASWSPETLGAIYVAASAGRRGVASALFKKFEVTARELGMKVLRMDSSLTAFPFYVRHGLRELGRGTHRLAAGLMMICVVMEKTL